MNALKPTGRGPVYARRPFGRFPLGFASVLVVLGFVALASSGPYVPFFPLVPLAFVLAFFVAPRLGRTVPRGSPRFGGVQEAQSDTDGREKELLRALERHEEITAARAAMETSLSIAQAEEMLAKLASGGHVEVRARAGTLAYALHAGDRREAGPKELAQARHEPID
jgi:membrane protein implicated in regulation of membrane protease activity